MRFKVCCIESEEEARLAIRAGASALGLVAAMPSGPGVIPEDRIAAIARSVPPAVSRWLLTAETEVDALVAQQRRCGVDTLQLVQRVPSATHIALRRALPGIRLVQVVHVTGPESREAARAIAADVDAILLDSGRPDAAVQELGGTGRTHDWAVSRSIVAACPVPVWLAGGLGPENAAPAIREVAPFGLDVCSGLRPEGRLDEPTLRRFAAALEGASTGRAATNTDAPWTA